MYRLRRSTTRLSATSLPGQLTWRTRHSSSKTDLEGRGLRRSCTTEAPSRSSPLVASATGSANLGRLRLSLSEFSLVTSLWCHITWKDMRAMTSKKGHSGWITTAATFKVVLNQLFHLLCQGGLYVASSVAILRLLVCEFYGPPPPYFLVCAPVPVAFDYTIPVYSERGGSFWILHN